MLCLFSCIQKNDQKNNFIVIQSFKKNISSSLTFVAIIEQWSTYTVNKLLKMHGNLEA